VNPILVDTNAYVAFKQGEPEARTILEHAPAIGFNTVVLGELLSGFAAGARDEANRKELSDFLSAPGVSVLPVDRRTAEHYATIYVALRKAGKPIPTNDIWVAASAIQHGLDLFSYDRHFQVVEGLRVRTSLSELES
jgi:tRNA(fMet)-specific endonuclease VapC